MPVDAYRSDMASFDTLATAKESQKAGFDRVQAEAVARAVGKLESEHLATKEDLYRVALYIVGAQTTLTAALTFGIVRFLS